MDLQLKDKIIIVTGGAKGIGEGITRVLAAEGAFPIIVGRSEEDNKVVVDSVQAARERVRCSMPCDVSPRATSRTCSRSQRMATDACVRSCQSW